MGFYFFKAALLPSSQKLTSTLPLLIFKIARPSSLVHCQLELYFSKVIFRPLSESRTIREMVMAFSVKKGGELRILINN